MNGAMDKKSNKNPCDDAMRDISRQKYRVFISYSHSNSDKALKVAEVLEQNGLIPLFDRQFKPGRGFHDQIKDFITHCHVFAPIITQESSQRGWVNQEIGYAMAMNIPVLPIADGQNPDQMIFGLHSVEYTDDLGTLGERLSLATFEYLVGDAWKKSRALYECAELQEHRTQMMVEYAKRVIGLGQYGNLRQKGALSSLHIPKKSVNHEAWRLRYAGQPRSAYYYRLQREERIVLETHVCHAGCKLIIDPYLTYGNQIARKSRIQSLVDFLKSMPDQKVRVVIEKNLPIEEHVTILGSWFLAQSVSSTLGKGYHQTIFTRHAPTINFAIQDFDIELFDLLEEKNISPENSRGFAIDQLEGIIADINSDIAKNPPVDVQELK